VGKIGISEHILKKHGDLDQQARLTLEQHPLLGALIIKDVPNLPDVAAAVAAYRERFDGLGYPREHKGEEIPLQARIIAVADAFSAMISDQTYRKGVSQPEALAKLVGGSGTLIDPELVSLFVETLSARSCPTNVAS
jgi:HD-GYP domain-containing protein (c-di-GMP phosphodiesterase class II)